MEVDGEENDSKVGRKRKRKRMRAGWFGRR